MIVALLTLVLVVLVLLWRDRGYLVAFPISLIVGFPFLQTSGLRSAIYVHEVVAAAGLAMLFVRRRALPNHVGTALKFVLLVAAYTFFVTLAGYLRLGNDVEGLLRATLAAIRISVPWVGFVCAAAYVARRGDLLFALRAVLCALMMFSALVALDALGVFQLGVFAHSGDSTGAIDEVVASGGFNRTSVGTFAQTGLFVVLALYLTRNLKLRWAIACSASFAWLLLASLSRSNYLAAALLLPISLIVLRKGRALAIGISLTPVLLLAGSRFEEIAQRLGSVTSIQAALGSIESTGRTLGWSRAVDVLLGDVWLLLVGGGYDTWQFFFEPYSGLAAGHNVFLHTTGELGILGGLMFVAFGWKTFSYLRSNGTEMLGSGNRLVVAFFFTLLLASLTTDILYPTTTMGRTSFLALSVLGLFVGQTSTEDARARQAAATRQARVLSREFEKSATMRVGRSRSAQAFDH